MTIKTENMCYVRVEGTPKPQKRHRTSSKNGFTRSYDPSSKDKSIFEKLLLQSKHKKLTGAISLSLTFYMPRPKHHFRTGKYKHKLKAKSPVLHINKPDIDNLIKFVLDCGNGILWKDDSSISQIEAVKIYSKYPRTEIEYWEVPYENTKEALE
jgi:Holliday junction resolvase RusA-like endonuclease